jgi:hypothetical protein
MVAARAGLRVDRAVVLHLQIRHEARSVSLSEVPLVLALFFAPPEVVLLARLAGCFPVWVLYRRQGL